MLGLLLGGCSTQTDAMQQALDFRAALLSAQGCDFTAHVTLDYGESVTKFTLACTYDVQKGLHLRVVEPQSIAQIEADVCGEEAVITFEDAQLALDSLADGNLTPLSAPFLVCKSWLEGYIDAAGRQDEQLRVSYLSGYGSKELTIDTWFLAQTGWPIRAEIAHDGITVLKLELTNFTMERNNDENADANLGGYQPG